MRVGIIGINHKLANLELRELLAKTCQRRFNPENSTHGSHSLVLLSTCNRTEVYFSSEDLASTHCYLLNILRQNVGDDFDQKLYSYFGQDCLLHLCRVTAGLDSAIIAETEIQGQVKIAYELAKGCHSLPFEMHYLFQKALAIAKKARSFLPLKPGLPDIEHAILQTGQHFFKEMPIINILFVGASEINEKIIAYFKPNLLPMNGSDSNSFPLEACKNKGGILENIPPSFSEPKVRTSREKIISNPTAFIGGKLGFKNKHLHQISLCNRTFEKGKLIANKHGLQVLPWDQLNSWHTYDWIIFGTKASTCLVSSHALPPNLSTPKLIIDLSVPRNADPLLSRHPAITLLNIDQLNRGLQIRKNRLLASLSHAEDFVSQTISQQFKLFQEKERNPLRICAISA